MHSGESVLYPQTTLRPRRLLSFILLSIGSTSAVACTDLPSVDGTEGGSTSLGDPSTGVETTPATEDDGRAPTSQGAPSTGPGSLDSSGGASETDSGLDTGMGSSTGMASSAGTSTGLGEESGTGHPGTSRGGTTGDPFDVDGDGHPAPLDCDDDDPQIHPGAEERCNGVDDDCDPATSEDGVVSIDGAGAYASINDALAAAPPGAELRICPGTYPEHLFIDQDVSLVAQEGASVTTIQGYANTSVVLVTSASVTVSGLTITGGNGNDLPGGGGLCVYGADPVVVEDCVITGNIAEIGGGIRGHAFSQLELSRTTISSNFAEDLGAGIAFTGDLLTLTDCTVEGNECEHGGGGLWTDGSGVVELSQTSVIDNSAEDGGGGLAVGGDSTVIVSDGVFERNSTLAEGGGAQLAGPGALLLSVDSDWGTGPDDNVPDDVEIQLVGTWASYGPSETFQCDPVTCL